MASSLDRTPNASPQFNRAGDVEHEKKLAQYDLSQEERGQISAMKKSMLEKTVMEKQSYNDKDQYKQRFDEKYADLAQRNNTPTPEHLPPNMRDRTLPKHQLMNMAHDAVKQDHEKRIGGFEKDYQRGTQDVLKRAADNGRGPQPQQERQQDRSFTAEQDFNRAATNDNSRDRDR